MRREEVRERKLRVTFARLLLALTGVAALLGAVFFTGRTLTAPVELRESVPLTFESTDKAYAARVELLASRPDKASRLELAQTLAIWANDTNRQGEKGPEAERVARLLVKDYPNDPVAWSALGYALEVQGRLTEAREAYTKGLTYAPTSVELNWHVAHTDSLSGNDASARAFLQVALQTSPEHAEALGLSGYYDVLDGKIDAAIDKFQRAVSSAPNARIKAESLLNLSAAYLNKKDTPKSLDAAKRSTQADPSYSAGHIGLARALVAGDKLEDAQSALAQALALYPSHSHVYIVRGQIAAKTQNWSEAARNYEQAVRVLASDNTVLGSAKAPTEQALLFETARVASQDGNATLVVRTLTTALTKYPAPTRALLSKDRKAGYPLFSKVKDDAAFVALLAQVK